MSSNIYIDIGSASYSSPDDILSISFSLINGGRVESSSDYLPLSLSLRFSDNKLTSSNCANVIIFPVFSLEDAAQGIYDTSGSISTASAYGCDVYANALEKILSKTT